MKQPAFTAPVSPAQICVLLVLFTCRLTAAELGGPQNQETVRPLTPAMQRTLADSTVQHSDVPIIALFSTVPEGERTTLALSLFLAVETDAEARSRLGSIIVHAVGPPAGAERRHLRLLTQAFLRTIQHPLKISYHGIDSNGGFDDRSFQHYAGSLISVFSGTKYLYLSSTLQTLPPLEKLRKVLVSARQDNPSASLATIQSCQNLLPP